MRAGPPRSLAVVRGAPGFSATGSGAVKPATRGYARGASCLRGRSLSQLTLLQKDREAEKQVAALRTSSLEDVVARQATQIEALQQRLEDARTQVREIAVQAIEGASGARALAHINQIAMEQAKHRAPGS